MYSYTGVIQLKQTETLGLLNQNSSKYISMHIYSGVPWGSCISFSHPILGLKLVGALQRGRDNLRPKLRSNLVTSLLIPLGLHHSTKFTWEFLVYGLDIT